MDPLLLLLLSTAAWEEAAGSGFNFVSDLFVLSRVEETLVLENISDGCCLTAPGPPVLCGGLCDFRLLGAKVLESVPKVRGALPGPEGPCRPFSSGRDLGCAGRAALDLALWRLGKGGTSLPSRAGGQPVRLLLSKDLFLQFL